MISLAPDIQEQLLRLDPVSAGKPRISEGQLRALSQETSWIEQRRRMESMLPY